MTVETLTAVTVDADLVARAQAGEAEAVGQLYDEHQPALFRYVSMRVAERQLAEDLTGEVFMRMLSGLRRYRATQAPFRAWLYRIAHNLLVDHHRQALRYPLLPLESLQGRPAEDDGAAGAIDQALTLEQVRQAMAELEDAQREVIALRFLSGLSLQEVAMVLEKSEMAVKALQHRGLAALRGSLVQEQAA